MDALTCIKTRRSVRKFTDEPISHETWEKVVEAASYAPSWKNTQVVRYTIVEDPAIIKEIGETAVLNFSYNTKTITRCPVLVVQSVVNGRSGYEKDGSFTTDKGSAWEMYDAGISAQTFCLAAHEYGIGTVIMGIIDDEKIGKLIDLPEGETVSALISAGHPAFAPDMPPRKSVDKLVRFK